MVAVIYGALAGLTSVGARPPCNIGVVVIFFEILLGLASLLIIWFALYTVYRLVNDES